MAEHDEPTSGRAGQHDAWLVNSPKVKVEIHSLRDFAEAVQGELTENFAPSMERGITSFMAATAPFGAGRLDEGSWFRQRHYEHAESIRALLVDAGKGLQALSAAASTIAREYEGGDGLAAAGVDRVYDVFRPGDDVPNLNHTPEQLRDKFGIPLPQEAKDAETAAKGGQTTGFAGPYADQTYDAGKPWEYEVRDDENTGAGQAPQDYPPGRPGGI